MFNFKNACARYQVARFYQLPTRICLKVFFFGKGNPWENLEKLIKEKGSNGEDATD